MTVQRLSRATLSNAFSRSTKTISTFAHIRELSRAMNGAHCGPAPSKAKLRGLNARADAFLNALLQDCGTELMDGIE
eukprot:5975212-Pyramimonas_sp.AAC.1